MKYKVGDEVVLRDDMVIIKFAGKTVKIIRIKNGNYHTRWSASSDVSLTFTDVEIDHEKTAELQKKDKTLNHYQGELEKIVEQRNNDDYTKALMKYGRVEGDGLDRLKPKSDKYARHKELTDFMHQTYIDKNKDYGDSFERTHDEIGSKAGLTRISDKFYRLQNIILNEHEHLVEDETVIDTLIDLANYAVMFAMELEEDGD